MPYTFVGAYPRHLASGRPLVFGDVVDASDLTPEDELLADLLVADSEAPEASTSNTEES
jgi:hypothetical protein